MRHYTMWLCLGMALAAPSIPAERQAGPPAVKMVRPVPRGPFGPRPVLKATYPKGVEGTAALRTVLLDPDTPVGIREEAFYHLSLRGEAAAPVLADVRPFVEKNPRWQLVYTETMAAVPDRRLVADLIRLAREGYTSEVRAEAISGLATDLMNRAAVTRMVRNPDGGVRFTGRDGSMSVDGGVVSHGEPIQPGDEQPILVLYRQLKDSPDPVLQRSLKGLGWAIDHLGAEIPNTPAAHEMRMAEARRLADGILVGTARVHVEQVFTRPDGGISGPHASRYYLGEEVMVEVPYDETGGRWKPTNRVTGPIKVYRSDMHID